ncbi:hypothetical protein [Epibacterium sp. Ofav1-8]|uniref:hypothetical protein n=1 Tax=Epibacterium sp. Ofav1-8 TaxID=2917735 RepID=UPI001EF506C1|nr:hypothetical protein [Epibacterium sp. Ofav1-8]
MIGLAFLVGGAVCLLLRWLELPSTVMAEFKTGTPSASITWILLLGYVLLLAIPFVPSAEMGLAILLVLGPSMALPVYVATILGLTIAFTAGRQAHVYRRSNVKDDAMEPTPAIAILHERFRDRPILRRILRFRGLSLIAMINMPGNTVVGGGGGIAMAVGYSRTLAFKEFLLCAAVAVAPVPTLFLIADQLGLEAWLRDWMERLLAPPL